MYPSDVCSNNHKTLYRSISQETRSKKKYDYWIFIDFIFLCVLSCGCSLFLFFFSYFSFFAFYFCSLGETLFSKVFLIQGVSKSIRSFSFVRFAWYRNSFRSTCQFIYCIACRLVLVQWHSELKGNRVHVYPAFSIIKLAIYVNWLYEKRIFSFLGIWVLFLLSVHLKRRKLSFSHPFLPFFLGECGDFLHLTSKSKTFILFFLTSFGMQILWFMWNAIQYLI